MSSQGKRVEMCMQRRSSTNQVNKFSMSAFDSNKKCNIVWRNVIGFSILHVGALYAIYLSLSIVKWPTTVFWYIFGYVCGMCGTTAGAHRLWAHRSYRARKPLRIFLMLLNCITLQGSIINWVRDHRMHHRYTETNADPHNSNRGLFFSHIGWLLIRKHSDIKNKAHAVDISDLWADSVLTFQKKYYLGLALSLNLVPVFIPILWGENLWNAFFTCFVLRYTVSLHYTFLVNSVAHMWGERPYDKSIAPAENKMVAWLAMGEGFHNYHHKFPWDYKTAELGHYSLNSTKLFIDVMASLGWAYDLKTVTKEVIEIQKKKNKGQ